MSFPEIESGVGERPSLLGRYRAFITSPGVPRVVVPGLVGRLPNGMISLATVLVVRQSTGSFAAAGAVAAGQTVASGIGAPVWGRLVDRLGARMVLSITGTGQGLALLALFVAAGANASLPALLALAAAVGAFLPPLSPVLRALWSRTLEGSSRDAAFAFETVVADVFYIVGPMLVAAVVEIAGVRPAVAVCAVLTAAGSLGVATAARVSGPGVSRPGGSAPGVPTEQHERHWSGALRAGAVRHVLAVAFFAMGAIIAVELGAVRFATAQGHPGLGGVLIAAFSVGSLAAGVYWGSRPQPGRRALQLIALLCVLTVGYGAMALAASLGSEALLFAALIATGVALAPMITTLYELMDAAAPPPAITESFAWLTAVSQAGAAAAGVLAGLLMSSGGPARGFLLAGAMAAAAVLLSLRARRLPDPERER